MGRAERRRRMRIVRRKLGSFALLLAPPFLRLLARSWKLEIRGQENWDAACARSGMLAALWHGRMVIAIPAGAGKDLTVLVSPSGDGRLVIPILRSFGYSWVLGSSNRNPARAVRELLERLQGGGRIVLTPDGPRGPRHSTNPGAAWIARAAGFPILPVGCVADRAWHLKSWDRFTIPKWGARLIVTYAEPIEIGPEASDEDLAAFTSTMRERMLAAEEAAFRDLGLPRDW